MVSFYEWQVSIDIPRSCFWSFVFQALVVLKTLGTFFLIRSEADVYIFNGLNDSSQTTLCTHSS